MIEEYDLIILQTSLNSSLMVLPILVWATNFKEEENVLDLPLWDVLWGVALLGELVVDEAELAALLTGRDSVQADVELGTVVGVGVPE